MRSLEAQGFRVVVHPANPVSDIELATISDYFLKKTRTWPNGAEVVPFDLSDPDVREAFVRDVHGRTVASLRSYWVQKVFDGTTAPPQELVSDAEMISLVSGEPRAIGYVSADADLATVKVIEVLTDPRRTHFVAPEFPSLARRARVRGKVILRAVIDAEGRVGAIEPVTRLPYGLTEAAIEAVRQWQFEPARRNGVSVEKVFEITVNFE